MLSPTVCVHNFDIWSVKFTEIHMFGICGTPFSLFDSAFADVDLDV